MFVIDLKFIATAEEIEKHLPGHGAFLEKYYNNNTFIASGGKPGRTGGVIIALAGSIEEVEKIIAEDTFHQYHVAEFMITEFAASKYHPDLKSLLS